MGLLPSATLITLLDSIATGKLIFDIAVGVTGNEANTVGKAASNDDNTLAAISDPQVMSDLTPSFYLRDQTLQASALYQTLGAYDIWWALDKHYNGLDGFMNANNVRASTHVVQIGFPLSPAQVMPPQVDPMATFAVTGSGAGTYAHVADIDTTQYGRAWLEAVVTSTIGANAITATVNGLQIDGVTPTIKTFTIAANSSVATTVSIGTMGTQADSYDSITGITITGGTAGDAFKVRSRIERVIPTTS